MGKLLNDAIIYATKKHDGKDRKGTKIPYIVHPLEALAIVASITEDEELMAAAVLHDTIEDTDATTSDIETKFGHRVAELVASESENKREELPDADTWKIRKEETIEHLKDASLDTRIVCLGDKLSNIRAISRDYEKLGEDLWQRFNIKDKSEHGWYYSSLAEIFNTDDKLNQTAACREYVELVEKVFNKQNIIE